MTKTVTFEKIVGEGKALGYVEGKPCFASGPLPGEVVTVEVTKDKPHFMEAAVVEIGQPSERRIAAAEAHFLVCSPWQNVDYDYQLELKRGMLADALRRPELQIADISMTGAPQQLGYRNKLEFSVTAGAPRSLAFHRRGSFEQLLELPEGCALGSEAMNQAALGLARQADAMNLEGLDTVTVRQSRATGEIIGHLAFSAIPKRHWEELITPELAGVVVSKRRGRSGHDLVWQYGAAQLVERLGGLELAYPYDGFFQTNVAMFEQILGAIMAQVPADVRVVDLYGGVGTIGLAAARTTASVVGVEINPSSVKLAEANAGRNGLHNYEAVLSPAHQIDEELLAAADVVIVDPPRAGLELKLVKALLRARPARIIYLSCNPVTQARDAAWLAEGYRANAAQGFDLYPGTLHLESLMVFDTR